MPYPTRGAHDLVGIDNRRAAYLATEHLLNAGARNVFFLAHSGGAPTIDARVAGFREAVLARGLPPAGSRVADARAVLVSQLGGADPTSPWTVASLDVLEPAEADADATPCSTPDVGQVASAASPPVQAN